MRRKHYSFVMNSLALKIYLLHELFIFSTSDMGNAVLTALSWYTNQQMGCILQIGKCNGLI